MTPAQLATFKAAILADVAQTANVAAGNHGALAAYYNAVPAAPINVWRPSIAIAELNTAIVWSEFALLGAALQATYSAMIAPGSIDSTSANVRAGFGTVFAGKVSLSNLTALAQRSAMRFEALFTSGNVCAAFGYQVSVPDIAAALGS